MMSILGKLDSWKNAVKGGALARLLGVLLGGSLNQRAFAIIGIVLTAASLYYVIRELLIPLLLAFLGGMLIWLSIRDYERSVGKSS
jgi:zinc transporter ZupT